MTSGKNETGQRYTEQDVLQRLLELGIIKEIRPPLPPDKARADRKLLPAIEGRPISERIIEERR